MRQDLNRLAEFTFDCWLLARGAKNFSVDGRTWERAVSDLLSFADMPNRQLGGLTTLFATPASSGVRHELDICASGGGRVIIVECKSQIAGITKGDAALIHEKTLDFYYTNPEQFSHERWWRILVSSNPVTHSVRTFCVHLGLILVDPDLLPLSVLLYTASRPVADMHLREPLLQDAIYLGEKAHLALQEKWIFNRQSKKIELDPNVLNSKDIQELLWLQKELGTDILDLYDLHRPGQLERRSQRLCQTLRVTN